jgi:hypothetical protein
MASAYSKGQTNARRAADLSAAAPAVADRRQRLSTMAALSGFPARRRADFRALAPIFPCA